jgi:hypothetical protein
MGQRHQIYLRLPAKLYREGNPNNRSEQTVGLHSQWLFGATAIRCLFNFLTFAKASMKEETSPLRSGSLQNAQDILEACYTVDIKSGFFQSLYKFPVNKDDPEFESCIDDPRQADNNNGITIIDLTGDKPRYCFLSIGHLECLHATKKGREHEDIPPYRNFVPISAEQWIALHYGDEWKNNPQLCARRAVAKHVKFLEGFEVISAERLAEIFPALKDEIKSTGGRPQKTKADKTSLVLVAG